MTASNDIRGLASGLAALSICESLILEMTYRKMLGHQEVINLIADAVAAHQAGATIDRDSELNAEIIRILECVLTNSHAAQHGLKPPTDV